MCVCVHTHIGDGDAVDGRWVGVWADTWLCVGGWMDGWMSLPENGNNLCKRLELQGKSGQHPAKHLECKH